MLGILKNRFMPDGTEIIRARGEARPLQISHQRQELQAAPSRHARGKRLIWISAYVMKGVTPRSVDVKGVGDQFAYEEPANRTWNDDAESVLIPGAKPIEGSNNRELDGGFAYQVPPDLGQDNKLTAGAKRGDSNSVDPKGTTRQNGADSKIGGGRYDELANLRQKAAQEDRRRSIVGKLLSKQGQEGTRVAEIPKGSAKPQTVGNIPNVDIEQPPAIGSIKPAGLSAGGVATTVLAPVAPNPNIPSKLPGYGKDGNYYYPQHYLVPASAAPGPSPADQAAAFSAANQAYSNTLAASNTNYWLIALAAVSAVATLASVCLIVGVQRTRAQVASARSSAHHSINSVGHAGAAPPAAPTMIPVYDSNEYVYAALPSASHYSAPQQQVAFPYEEDEGFAIVGFVPLV